MSHTLSIEAFWEQARFQHPELPQEPVDAWAFGATPEMADELLALVLEGTKTATASSLWDYQAEGEELPRVGLIDIVLDGAGLPAAIIETVAVDIVPFNEVSAEHAFAEGEGDRSLAYWREAHESFWRTYGAPPQSVESSEVAGVSRQSSSLDPTPSSVPHMEGVDEANLSGLVAAVTVPCGFAETMPVVCQRFRLLYRSPDTL